MNTESFRIIRKGIVYNIEAGTTFKITREISNLRSQSEVYYAIEDKEGKDITPNFYCRQKILLPASYESIKVLAKPKWFSKKKPRPEEDMIKEFESWVNNN